MPAARVLLVLASFGGCGLMIRALVVEPPPLKFALVALGVYVALVTFGVLRSEFGMFADVVTAGPRDARGVALTLDDAPSPTSTPRALELLARASARATFFLTAAGVDAHPQLLHAIVERGHAIGLLGAVGPGSPRLATTRTVRREVESMRRALQSAGCPMPSLYRSSTGRMTPGAAAELDRLGMVVVAESSGDGPSSNASDENAAERAVRGLSDGAILRLALIDSRGADAPTAGERLVVVLEAARRLQLDTVRLDEWLADGSSVDG